MSGERVVVEPTAVAQAGFDAATAGPSTAPTAAQQLPVDPDFAELLAFTTGEDVDALRRVGFDVPANESGDLDFFQQAAVDEFGWAPVAES